MFLQRRLVRLLCTFGLAAALGTGLAAHGESPTGTRIAVTARWSPVPLKLPVVDGNDVRFNRIASTQGLSQTRVAQMIQDDQGFLWFGTQGGLNRYDGYRFKVFSHAPGRAESLGGVFVYALFTDRQGSVWVGTDQSLDRYDRDTETFRHYPIDATNPIVIHISQDRDGWLWLSTRLGLYRLNPDTGAVTRFTYTRGEPNGRPVTDVKSSGEDRSGRFWVATSEGLDEVDRHAGRATMHVPMHVDVREFGFHEDRTGTFWISYGSDNGLAILDRATGTVVRHILQERAPDAGALTGVYAMLEDHSGTMWFATMGNGLLRFDAEQRRFVRYRKDPAEPESLTENRVISLLQDREGNLWAGFHAAAPTYFSRAPPTFQKYEPALALPGSAGENLVNAIYEDRRAQLWLGAGGALNRVDRRTGSFTPHPLRPGGGATEVLDIREDPAGNLWVATLGHGLNRLDSVTGRLSTYVHDPSRAGSISSNIVTRIFFDHNGVLWAATWDGLNRFDVASQSFTTFKRDPAAGTESYFEIAEGHDGALWLGSTSGLYRFDPGGHTFREYKHDPADARSLSNNTLNTVVVTRAGVLWLGTQNGLNRFDPVSGAFRAYYTTDGLPGNAVSCILEDEQSRLWFSTNNGISRFDPDAGTFRNFSVVDGLPGVDLTAWGACARGPGGEMHFGGFAGAVSFYPGRIVDDAFRPPIVLTEFRVSGQTQAASASGLLRSSITQTKALELGHDISDFTLEFAALAFSSPTTNRYRYRMEGLTEDWQERTSDQRNVSFTTLPAGRYVFRVQAATSRGPWSTPGATLQITVLPPWWSTWWFRLAVFAGIGSCLSLAYLWRLRQFRRAYELRLHERVGERTRIARDLHDSLLQGYQGLVLRLHAVQELLPSRAADARAMLDSVMDRADQAMAEAREAVQELRVAPPLDLDLGQALRALGGELALLVERSKPAPELHVVVHGRLRALSPTVGDDIYGIAREALRNAYRHAGARVIRAELTYARSGLHLSIQDDGCGFIPPSDPSTAREGRLGLRGLYERAAHIGANLRVHSEPGTGTVVSLELKARRAYATVRRGAVATDKSAARRP